MKILENALNNLNIVFLWPISYFEDTSTNCLNFKCIEPGVWFKVSFYHENVAAIAADILNIINRNI